ncbi:hypothetical protein AB7M22_002509 [Pseudomonas sp. ADAK2 TE3594]
MDAKFWKGVNNIDQQSWPMLETVGLDQATGTRQSSEPEVPDTSWVQVILR